MSWSATAETEEELMTIVTEHVIEHHKEIGLNSESIASIKGLIKES